MVGILPYLTNLAMLKIPLSFVSKTVSVSVEFFPNLLMNLIEVAEAPEVAEETPAAVRRTRQLQRQSTVA